MATPREHLATALRRARLDADLTQEALAARMGVDRSVVAHAESATSRVPSDATLKAWADHTATNADKLIGMAEVVRSAVDGVPGWIEDYIRAEAEAYNLRFWSPLIITPVFQTPAYARALLMGAQTDTSDDAIDPLVAAKLARQQVLERAEVTALIDELAVRRLIGSAEVMSEQLTVVSEIAERPNVTVQLVPADAAVTAGCSGEICIAQADGFADTLHNDASPQGRTTDSPTLVRGAAVIFDRVRRHALPSALSRDRIIEIRDELWKI